MKSILLVVAIMAIIGCGDARDQAEKTESQAAEIEVYSLQAVLDARKAEFASAAPAEMIQLFEKGVREVGQSGVMETALKLGDQAPDFELPNATGEKVRLSELLAEGPVVLSWYRGGWCPYCNIQLNAYNEWLDRFESAGGRLVAISPEVPDSSFTTKEKAALKFEVLSDIGNKVAEQFGIVYTLPTELGDALGQMIDFEAYNADKSMRLPLAVTYIIDSESTIRYAFVHEDYKVRAEPDEILKALQAI